MIFVIRCPSRPSKGKWLTETVQTLPEVALQRRHSALKIEKAGENIGGPHDTASVKRTANQKRTKETKLVKDEVLWLGSLSHLRRKWQLSQIAILAYQHGVDTRNGTSSCKAVLFDQEILLPETLL